MYLFIYLNKDYHKILFQNNKQYKNIIIFIALFILLTLLLTINLVNFYILGIC